MIVIAGLLPKWAIFAPVFIPLFIRLGVAPQTLLAAYRLGSWRSATRRPRALGTIVAMMIPYSVVVLITWLIFFIAWYLLGIPMGSGYPP